jgi:uncharacterized protein (TIGR03083 family)
VGLSPQPRQSLDLVDEEQQRLCERLSQLGPRQLEQPSNLPGWSVFDLAVHITRVLDSIGKAVQRASVGDRTPAFGVSARPRELEIREMTPAEWVELHRSAFAEIRHVVGELSDDDLERRTFPHPQGERSIRWFCTQLLAEVAFHRWDLECSLGARAPLDEATAGYLLPFLLDTAEPLFGGLRSPSDVQAFRVATPYTEWLLTVSADGTRVAEGSSGDEGPRVSAVAGWLALAVYGRVRVDGPDFEVVGPSDTADRFAAIFGPR